jgi:CRP-like cAMP-binding protein
MHANGYSPVLEREPLRALFEGGPKQRVRIGAELLGQGYVAEHVLLLERGVVKLLRTFADGRSTVVGLRGRHALLGLPAALLGDPQPLSVVAECECDIRCIPAPEFVEAAKGSPTNSRQVHRLLAQELIGAYEQVAVLACLSARERLQQFLALIGSEFSAPGSDCVELPIRHWELAQLLAVTPQYLSRLMHELLVRGVVRRRGSRWFLVEQAPAGASARQSPEFI